MIIEVLNIPWEAEMVNFDQPVTKDALYVIQKAVRKNLFFRDLLSLKFILI